MEIPLIGDLIVRVSRLDHGKADDEPLDPGGVMPMSPRAAAIVAASIGVTRPALPCLWPPRSLVAPNSGPKRRGLFLLLGFGEVFDIRFRREELFGEVWLA